MKRGIFTVLLLCVAFFSWAFGFKIRVDSPSEGLLVFAPEEQINAQIAPGVLLPKGRSERVFHFPEENLVLLIQLSESGLLRVDIIYLDEQDQPLPNRLPTRLAAEGTFAGLRVRHPYWVDDGV